MDFTHPQTICNVDPVQLFTILAGQFPFNLPFSIERRPEIAAYRQRLSDGIIEPDIPKLHDRK